jgi:hypothetical protein
VKNADQGPLGFLSQIALCRAYVPETIALVTHLGTWSDGEIGASRCSIDDGGALAMETARFREIYNPHSAHTKLSTIERRAGPTSTREAAPH